MIRRFKPIHYQEYSLLTRSSLGDKENHIASIHLTQMLYIWPYITFFSFPLFIPYILNALLPQSVIPLPLRMGSTRHLLPRLGITSFSIGAMLIVVHYNTVVHPFTLADNRHYPFYVFRLLLRHPAIKYMVTPIYYICAWAAIATMSGFPKEKNKKRIQSREENEGAVSSLLPSAATSLEPGTRVNFVLVWLLTTSLSLVTAPLVEPRYFIIPWLIWRLHVPSSMPPGSAMSGRSSSRSTSSKHDDQRHKSGAEEQKTPHWLSSLTDRSFAKCDYRLVLETLWFLGVNWVVGYVFLHWEFEWAQEKGSVQRFMW